MTKNKFLLLVILIVTKTNCESLSPDFIIKPTHKNHVGGSKNKLKEKIGQSARQSVNFTTELNSLIGKLKIDFADSAEKLCKVTQLANLQKNDGQIQVQISSIQSCFADLIENLIDNKGYFKKASRGDMGGLMTELNSISNTLQCQVKKFEQLSKRVALPSQILAQFELSAKEMKELQEKVKGLKCLKKS